MRVHLDRPYQSLPPSLLFGRLLQRLRSMPSSRSTLHATLVPTSLSTRLSVVMSPDCREVCICMCCSLIYTKIHIICSQYYEGIGTLPDRLQRPMWRSPTASAVVVRRRVRHLCAKHSLDLLPAPDFSQDHRHAQDHDLNALSERYRQEQVARHKGDVSRHRARWDRAATPPGYWEIDFQDT
jgi:hypothetical protein